MRARIVLLAALSLSTALSAAELPDGYWGPDRTQPILDSTMRVRLAPDLAWLSAAERRALDELIAAGRILNNLYETQKHRGAALARESLEQLHAADSDNIAVQNLLDVYYLSKGPIATTLDNTREAILPTDPEQPGKNVYPFGLTRTEIDAYLAANPDKAGAIRALRTVVRRATKANLAADIAALDAHPAVDALHPGLRAKLEGEPASAANFYAVPYALAYAEELGEARAHLLAAAELVANQAPDFAAYLRNRARDFLSGDYESGDASWVSGDFANLNIQVGSYETYDDALLGAKAFYSASILSRDAEKSAALAEAMAGLQAIEDSLPYDSHKTVRTRIPVGVYDVVADFGQARGANTATILPNEAAHARKYGRTILIRANILGDPVLFENSKKKFDAAVSARFEADLSSNGKFNRTLWHEVGHYLGVSVTADGRSLSEALGDRADLLEELKSDLVSLFAAPALRASGYHDDVGLRGHYADGILRTLQSEQPRPEQPYQNMQLMQFNFFMEHGLLEMDGSPAELVINYARYHEVVTSMLEQVLAIQHAGDYAQADAFVTRWNYWDEQLHGALAGRLRDAGIFRRTLVKYSVLEN